MGNDGGSPSCWDCEREVSRRALQPTPVHIDHEDGPGYDRVEVPLCRGCRLKRFPTHECPECGEEWLDMTDAVECCQHRRGRPMPDGGEHVTEGTGDYETVQNATPTGRSAQFYAPVRTDDDVEAIAQRVAQFVAIGLQRGEIDSVQVTIQEAVADGGDRA